MKAIILLIVFLFSINLKVDNNPGTNIRGKVVTFSEYSKVNVPYQSIVVTLMERNPSSKKQLVNETITNSDGMYFFYKVPAGDYILQVNKNKKFPIKVSPIINRKIQFQDIPVIKY